MKKLLLLLCALLTLGGSTWATTYTITYGTETGTFYRSGSASTDWSSKWVSNEAGKPVVTITTSVNNMNGANARIAPQTYTIYAEPGYKVIGFAMNCPTFGATVTVTPAGESAVEVAQGGTLVVNSSASSFVFAGGSNQARIQAGSNDGGSFTITVEEEDWKPSIDGKFLTVGNKVSSFTAATAADDNDHWYILTQVRNAETPMYNTGAAGETLMRASSPFTLSSLDGALTSTNSAYLIRFKSVGEGTYNIQFANGYWIDGGLKAANFNTAGTYAFYNCNGGSGSYFAWNLNNKSGSKVDNNGAGYGLAFWGSGEVSGTSGNNVWYMYETTLYVPASTINVTYEQYVDGVATGTTYVETVEPNSAINVPASFYTGYSDLAYDKSTTGTIADADVTIQVNINKKSGVTLPAELSNSKKYRLVCERGGLSTYYDEANSRTVLASPVRTALGVSAKEFAILNYDSKYYLYSVSDSKFVTYQEAQIAPLANMVTGTSDQITFAEVSSAVYAIKFDNSTSKYLNSSDSYTYGIVINGWGGSGYWDGGNQYIIEEVGDFDPTTALAILEFSDVIAKLEAYPYGTGLGQYSLVVESTDYTSQAATIISGLKTQGYTAENLTNAQLMLAGTTINLPKANTFLRIRSSQGVHACLKAADASTRMTFTTTEDKETIFLYSTDNKIISYSKGLAVNNVREMGSVGGEASIFSVVAAVSGNVGQYSLGATYSGNTNYLYSTGVNGSNADRNTLADQFKQNNSFTLETVSSLPVTITAAGYATLYAPVALTIPTGVKAYVAVDNGEYLTLTEVETTIPANTGVILEGSEGTYDFDITTGGSVGSNALTGTVAAIARPDGSYILSNGTSGVGFYKDGAMTIPGFKAYLTAGGGTVKTFRFNEETAIEALESAKEASGAKIYNMAGQRVAKAKKGIYIVGGRKVVIK